jgi:hypothetical protein
MPNVTLFLKPYNPQKANRDFHFWKEPFQTWSTFLRDNIGAKIVLENEEEK